MVEETKKKAEKGKAVKKKVDQKIVIDADGLTLGRIASFTAKQALGGKSLVIFNAEKALVSGKTEYMFKDYKNRYDAKGQANPNRHGPKRPRDPDRFIRRAVRGMLPWKKARGKDAFKRVMTYMGKPVDTIIKEQHVDITKAQITEIPGAKRHYDYFVTVGELCKYLGGKNE